ncbi:MAG: DUF4339 domain-containing protein [Planctomycetes bacterium]|nr:DUF4339 domain-containing protein [Planctomycetota bacterium]
MATEWYVFKNNKRMGPFSSLDLKRLVTAGSITIDDLVWKEGTSGWVPAKSIKGLFGSGQTIQPTKLPAPSPQFNASDTNEDPFQSNSFSNPAPIQLTPPSLSAGSRGSSTKTPTTESGLQGSLADELRKRRSQATDAFQLYRLFWSRILISDFHLIHATTSEVARLEAAPVPVNSPLAQDYASWRRSLLMVCILVLGITLLFTGYEVATETFNPEKHMVIRLQALSLFLFQVVAFLLSIVAAFNWANIKVSKVFSRLAWAFQFAGPFLVFFAPLSLFVSNPLVLFQLGVSSIVTLAPKIFGLFPGIIRCSLSIKTLLPESAVAGWLSVVIVPIHFLFMLVPAIAAIQFSFIVLGIGLLLMGVGSFVTLFKSNSLLKPTSQEEASRIVAGIKRLQSVFQISGIGCIAFQVFRSVEITTDMANNLLLFVFSYVGNVTLLTVAMSDFMLGMIRESQLQTEAFLKSELLIDYQSRLEHLAACGLTDFDSGEMEFASKIKEKGLELAHKASAASGVIGAERHAGGISETIDDFG